MRHIIPILVLAAVGSACTSAHLQPYTPKRRIYEEPTTAAPANSTASPGSLWQPNAPAALLFTDQRALRDGDLVVVRVEEVADARRSADTDLSRDQKVNADVGAFLRAAGTPILDQVQGQATGGLGSSFSGKGETARTERLMATVPATVRKVLPNGNLFIEGHRVVLVNSEEQHFYISGVIRPIDIDQSNSVKSSVIADAEIEFTGRGVLSNNTNPGWLARLLGALWPF